MQSDCLDETAWKRFLEKDLPTFDRDPLETHVAACPACMGVLASLMEPDEPANQRIPPLRLSANAKTGILRRPVTWNFAAAAMLLIAAAGAWKSGILTGSQTAQTSGESAPLRLEREGVYVQKSEDALWSISGTLSSGRRAIELRRGMLALEVSSEEHPIEVRTPHGRFRDVGTRFRLWVDAVPGWPGKTPVTYTRLEVSEGIVEAMGQRNRVTVPRGHRGYVGESGTPVGPIRFGKERNPDLIRERIEAFLESLQTEDRNRVFMLWQEILNFGEPARRQWERKMETETDPERTSLLLRVWREWKGEGE